MMSYFKPDKVPEEQKNNTLIALNTTGVLRLLSTELEALGLKIAGVGYYKNEYCSYRNDRPCDCPHWLKIKIERLHERIYEPEIWFWVCKRKRVYEIRWGYYYTSEDNYSYVGDDFFINDTDRTQKAGSHIHSYGLTQAAQDIAVAYQAAEIKHYQEEGFKKYHARVFREINKEKK